MDAQNAIRFCIADELDHAVRLQVRLGARVGGKGERADFVLDAVLLEIGFAAAHPCHFGVGVHDAGDGAVVDVAVACFDEFDCCDALFFGFVREHGPEGAVADDADVRELGAVLLVDYEAAFGVDFQADVFESEAGGVGTAANSDEDDVCIEL